MKDQHRTFRAVKWAKTEGKVGNTHVYEPCSHSGPCSPENNCSCVSVDNLCTKLFFANILTASLIRLVRRFLLFLFHYLGL